MAIDLAELAELQAFERLAWTPGWERARAWLAERALATGADLEVDQAANQWFTLRGDSAAAVVVGGHADGDAIGVFAGLEVLRRVAARGRSALTVRLVNWADGEGVRFGRPLVGASAVAGAFPDWFMAMELRDRDGLAFREVAGAHGVDLKLSRLARRQLTRVRSYVELGLGEAFGVAGVAVGVERCTVTWRGERAEAARARFAAAVPGATSDLAGAVQLIDVRARDEAGLERLLEGALDASEEIAEQEGLSAEWSRVWRATPLRLQGTPELVAQGLYGATAVASAGVPVSVVLAERARLDEGVAGLLELVG
jgi:hypothetical protein